MKPMQVRITREWYDQIITLIKNAQNESTNQ